MTVSLSDSDQDKDAEYVPAVASAHLNFPHQCIINRLGIFLELIIQALASFYI